MIHKSIPFDALSYETQAEILAFNTLHPGVPVREECVSPAAWAEIQLVTRKFDESDYADTFYFEPEVPYVH